MSSAVTHYVTEDCAKKTLNVLIDYKIGFKVSDEICLFWRENIGIGVRITWGWLTRFIGFERVFWGYEE